MSQLLRSRFQKSGPKRILALDGGGIRGAITLGFLQRMEDLLRNQHQNDQMLLCDYFDLIGGTSTGSIIATLLALGYDVETIRKLYLQLGNDIFGQQNSVWNPLDWSEYLSADFDATPLENSLHKILEDRTLGSDDLRTGLCIVAKRADTFSTWPMFNNPDAAFYEPLPDSKGMGNKDYLLRDIIRASTAAPAYFKPQLLDLGDQQAAFVDGGVSMANNPAWQLFLMATADGYKLKWEASPENLMIVSVGTGAYTKATTAHEIGHFNKLSWAKSIADFFMEDASWQNQTILQLLGETPTPFKIDSEIGNLVSDHIGGKKWLYYVRYNAWLQYPKDKEEMAKYSKIKALFSQEDLIDMREMSNAKRAKDMALLGDFYADIDVLPEHFPERFRV